jgi:hypothetical protein
MPEYVRHILDVRGEWRDVTRRFHRSIRKNELRWVRKYGYHYEVSRSPQHFEDFFQRMYLPTMKARHGKRSSPMLPGVARQYFRHGWLFRIMRNGDWVSGMVCHPRQDILVTNILGVQAADTQLIREGAISAAVFAAIQWANQHGFIAVNLLGSDPFLNAGSFQHKRKWGTMVRVPQHLHRQIWTRVQRHTPAVARFLKENPAVVVGEEDDRLHGLIFTDAPQTASAEMKALWEKHYATPGLSHLLVKSVYDVAEPSTGVDDADLVIPIPPTSFHREGHFRMGDDGQ